MPERIPLVILRGSGETTAALARLAAEHGVRTLAHAEGGGVLYVHSEADRDRALAMTEATLDRLGVCNRLNLALVDRGAAELLPDLLAIFRDKGLEVRGTPRAIEAGGDGVLPHDRDRLGYEWANEPERIATVTLDVVDDLDDALRIANEETSGLAAGIVTEEADAATPLSRRLPWHRRLLARDDTVHGRLRADRSPGDRHQRRHRPRPARPGHVSRPLAPPVPSRRRRHPDPLNRPVVVKLGTGLVVGADGSVRSDLLHARAREIATLARRRRARVRRLFRGDRARPAQARPPASAPLDGEAPGGLRPWPGQAPIGLGGGAGRTRDPRGPDPPRCRRRGRPNRLRQRAPGLRGALPARRGARRERERRDGHGRDHIRRQRRARGPGRSPRPGGRARPADGGRGRVHAGARHSRR